jgi:hypothetical protein
MQALYLGAINHPLPPRRIGCLRDLILTGFRIDRRPGHLSRPRGSLATNRSPHQSSPVAINLALAIAFLSLSQISERGPA